MFAPAKRRSYSTRHALYLALKDAKPVQVTKTWSWKMNFMAKSKTETTMETWLTAMLLE